jgi:hypothetical protein
MKIYRIITDDFTAILINEKKYISYGNKSSEITWFLLDEISGNFKESKAFEFLFINWLICSVGHQTSF